MTPTSLLRSMASPASRMGRCILPVLHNMKLVKKNHRFRRLFLRQLVDDGMHLDLIFYDPLDDFHPLPDHLWSQHAGEHSGFSILALRTWPAEGKNLV